MIHLLFTGGTISMRRDDSLGGNVPQHGAADLLALAAPPPGLRYRSEDWARSPACHFDVARLWALRGRVAELIAGGGVHGVVVTHGTDILEETAYLLARTLAPTVPVVVTGAMLTPGQPGWDGAANLRDAMVVAADSASAGRGAMVVFAGRILDGRDAVKTHATAPDAFEAPHAGPVGRVANGVVRYDTPIGPPRRPVAPPVLDRRVAVVPMVVGDDGAMLDALRRTHDGVVIAAFGSGNVPPGAVPAIRRWLDGGKPVVLATRCLRGEVEPSYAFDGGGAQLVRLGAVPAGPRSLSHARMELMIALSAGVPYGAGA